MPKVDKIKYKNYARVQSLTFIINFDLRKGKKSNLFHTIESSAQLMIIYYAKAKATL